MSIMLRSQPGKMFSYITDYLGMASQHVYACLNISKWMDCAMTHFSMEE